MLFIVVMQRLQLNEMRPYENRSGILLFLTCAFLSQNCGKRFVPKHKFSIAFSFLGKLPQLISQRYSVLS